MEFADGIGASQFGEATGIWDFGHDLYSERGSPRGQAPWSTAEFSRGSFGVKATRLAIEFGT